MPLRLERIRTDHVLKLHGVRDMTFDPRTHIELLGDETLPRHTNGLIFLARGGPQAESGGDGPLLLEKTYYSIGGGFIVDEEGMREDEARTEVAAESGVHAAYCETQIPHDYSSAFELFSLCEAEGTSVAELARRNEAAERTEAELNEYLALIWSTMDECIERGMHCEGALVESGAVVRRAPKQRRWLEEQIALGPEGGAVESDWAMAWAIAVNEENAAGGRVVTAPTNGAAGILPAVCKYYTRFVEGADAHGVGDFLLTASTIGGLFKRGASISGAEVGCQGEVGVACSMAAGALAAAMGGSLAQVEMAAEMAMEHNLGLTCDPLDGRVLVPCIERNGFGATRAINCARLALRSGHRRVVSLDAVIETMWQTGQDMNTKYKETSLGGLAVNATFC
jgi:L-serine dehydratase